AGGLRRLFPLALACAATFDALSLGTAVWLAPILLIALGLLVARLLPLIGAGVLAARRALAELGLQVAGFAVLGAVLGLPAILTGSSFLGGVTSGGGGPLTSSSELGNLIHPLKKLQLFGIWPTGDFR